MKIIATPEPDDSRLFIPTLNNTGFMTTNLDIFSQAFVDYAASTNDWALEIGAAYGVATLAALDRGAKIVCNDVDLNHLAVIKERTPKDAEGNLQFAPGAFPEELDFNQAAFSAILICRVLHLFDGDTIATSLKMAYAWLKPGGKLFVVADTPYLKNMAKFIPVYEKRKSSGQMWPGLMKNTKAYVSGVNGHWPKQINLLDKEVLRREMVKAGFKIERAETLNRIDYPEDRRLDGRESVGIIGVKI